MTSASATPAEHCRLLQAAVAYAEQIVLWVGKDLWNIIGGKEESLKEDRRLLYYNLDRSMFDEGLNNSMEKSTLTSHPPDT